MLACFFDYTCYSMAEERWFANLITGLFTNHNRAFSVIRQSPLPGFGLFAFLLLLIGSAGRMLVSLRGYGFSPEAGQLPFGVPGLLVLLSLHLLAFLLTWYLGAVMVSKLSASFGPGMGLADTWKLVVVSYAPFMLVQPLTLLAIAGQWIGFVGLVSALVLFAQGVTCLKFIPRKKMVGFTLVAFFVFLGLSYLFTNIMMDIFVGLFIFKG